MYSFKNVDIGMLEQLLQGRSVELVQMLMFKLVHFFGGMNGYCKYLIFTHKYKCQDFSLK